MGRGSLRLRLLAGGAVSILVALALSAAGLVLLFERHVERRVETELDVHLDQILAGVDRAPDGTLVVAEAPGDPRFAAVLSGLYWQVVTGEETVLGSRSLWDVRLELPPDELADGTVHRHRLPGPGGTELIAVERSVRLPSRLGGGTVRAAVAVEVADVEAATRAFAVDLLPYVALIAAFLIAAAYTQVAVGLQPLVAIRGQVVGIRAGRLRRLGRAFPDEILPLAAEVDALLDARDAQLEKARARAADLAHGLRTPLQVLTGDVERLRGRGDVEIAADIEQVTVAMSRHVERELARTRMAAAKPGACARVREVVERVLAVVTRTPAGAAIDWATDVPEDTVARIDPDDLAEAIGNLVENAARHARTVASISTRRDGPDIVVTIADDGPGIPPELLERALRRGDRLDSSGGAAGLGLAIVRDVAEEWDGSLELRKGASGLEVELRLPGG